MAERVIAIEDNNFKSYPGNYDYYKNLKDQLKLQEIKEPVVKPEKVKKPKKVDEVKKRELETVKVEKIIEGLENEINHIDVAMTDDKLDYKELNKLYCEKEELRNKRDEAMELWLSLN